MQIAPRNAIKIETFSISTFIFDNWFGFNITNSHEEEDVFTSSAVRVLSNSNTLSFNKVTNSYAGILLEDTSDNTISDNLIDDVDFGIVLTKADDNQIRYNTILDTEENDIELTNTGYSTGSTGNTITHNEEIGIIKIINS